mmetsp:Transcript_50478/g.135006  ORF Transcript_50478/g.135006 Transcript_50478/m.135006 type:complete len:528 (-) Transcript_50478:30-1613(-)
MDSLLEQLDSFGAEALDRVKKSCEQLRDLCLEQLARVEELHEASVDQLMQEVHSLRESARKALTARPARAWPTPVVAQPKPGSFGELLLEPAVPVRLGEGTLHVHLAVLRQVPFFAALVDGTWRDAAAPSADLPCSVAEFALLLQRLYTGEPLGTPALPVDDLASGLRLAAAADMLIMDQQLPELPSLLRASIAGTADIEAAREAAGKLPPSVANLLLELEGSAELAAAAAAEAVSSVRTAEARRALALALASQPARVDAERLASAAQQILAHAREPEDVAWAAYLAREHLTPSQATAVFRTAPEREFHSCFGCVRTDPFAPCDEVLCSAFAAHLLRCAEAGVLEEAFECGVDDGSTGQSMHLVYMPGNQQASMCVLRRRSRLLFDEGSARMLAAALRASRREVCPLARRMAQMLPSQLAAVLTPEVLSSIRAFVEPVVDRLLTDQVSAARWASQECLAALPAGPRRAACAALLGNAELLEPSVLAAVAAELVEAAAAGAGTAEAGAVLPDGSGSSEGGPPARAAAA